MKFHSKILLSLSILLVSIIPGYAQQNFKPGFVLTASQDTLHGLIAYKQRSEDQRCLYKAQEHAATVTYAPTDIVGYGLSSGEYFKSHSISSGADGSMLVFLQVLIDGRASLYRYQKNFYITKNDSILYPLKIITHTTEVNGNKISKPVKQYINTLRLLLSDCAALEDTYEQVTLTPKSLIHFVETYNQCLQSTYTKYLSNRKWTEVRLGVIAGSNISKLKITSSDDQEKYLFGTYEMSSAFMGGFSLDLVFPHINEQFSLHADLLYTQANYHYHHEFTNNLSQQETDDVTIKMKMFKIPLGFQYTFSERKFTPFINAGVSITRQISPESHWTQSIETLSSTQQNEDDAIAFNRNNQFGWWAGVGLQRSVSKKYAAYFSIRYEGTNGITSVQTDMERLNSRAWIYSSVSNYQIVVGIKNRQ